ncbi:MAG: hypothetical protein ABIS06_14600 [Vicinamibacterales bacterium]
MRESVMGVDVVTDAVDADGLALFAEESVPRLVRSRMQPGKRAR